MPVAHFLKWAAASCQACAHLKVCTGLTRGGEAATHAMHNIFEADETDAVLRGVSMLLASNR